MDSFFAKICRAQLKSRSLAVALLPICMVAFVPAAGYAQTDTKPSYQTGAKPKTPKQLGVKDLAARKKVCRTYAGKLIGYYGKVYRVAGCKRYPVPGNDVTANIRRYGTVRAVESDVVKLIPLARQRVKRRLTCRESEGRVFLTLSGQVFQVAGCRRYTFPDWETYLEYRKKGRVNKRSFVEIEDHLAQTLPEARVYPSVLDSDSAAFLRDNEKYDIIPAKRACKGIEGRYVSYYSLVYKIERCKRRPVSIEPTKLSRLRLKELTSSQWLSIPEGKPLKK